MTYNLPKVISTSQINTYRHCPRKYFLQYVLKIKTDIKSEALEMGSRVHAGISSRIFKSDIPIEHLMLTRAKAILEMYPPNPILETTYEDPDNPGRIWGNLHGKRAICVFDFHWSDIPFAGDWKTGKFDPRYVDGFEVQAYISNELYKEKYGRPLNGFSFEFLKVGKIYNATCLVESEKKHEIEETLDQALENINLCKFDKCKGPLCNWCDLIEYCKKDHGLEIMCHL